MMPTLRPDTLNGQKIFRVITDEGGVNHVNQGIFFPPGINVGRAPIVHPDELVEQAMKDLITVSDQTGDPVIKAQAVMFRKKLHDHQKAWLARAAQNEREIIRAFLNANGFSQAAGAL